MKGNARRAGQGGFTLLELLVAMVVFSIVAAVALGMIAQSEPIYNQQQGLSGLNMAMRNSVSQIELDLVNAGTGYYVGANVPSWPIGVTVFNSTGGSCYDATTNTYGPGCFDTLHIIAMDPGTPPGHPDPPGASCVSTSTSSILFAQPTGGMSLADYAARFADGDQILLVKSDGSQMTTVKLTQDGSVSGTRVRLQHNPTGANGTNNSSDDPLGITTTANNKLGTDFCTDDWILKLSAVTYQVDTTVPANPKLVRTRGGTSNVLAEQVIGFKLGASLWNAGSGTSSATYNFDHTSYSSDYSRIRSMRVSLIGRTTPTSDPTYRFRNTFDGGPYQIQATSVVVNPRNLSMKDQ